VPWSRLLDGESASDVFDLLAVNVRRLVAVSGMLRGAIVEVLADEGFSMRQAAKRLGVSHQRISALRRRRD
jgi:hypothetical protein